MDLQVDLDLADAHVLDAYETHRATKQASHQALVHAAVMELVRKGESHVTPQDTQDLYDLCNGLAQSVRCCNGRILETAIKTELERHAIPFLEQCSITEAGIVSKSRRGHTYDFIIGSDVGEPVTNAVILSCKSSVRERYLQDCNNLPCKEMYLITLDRVTQQEKFKRHKMHIVTVCRQAKNLSNVLRKLKPI